jgi:hypothetical protein
VDKGYMNQLHWFQDSTRPLILTVEPSRSFQQIGVCKSRVQAKSLSHLNFRIVKWIIVSEDEADLE